LATGTNYYRADVAHAGCSLVHMGVEADGLGRVHAHFDFTVHLFQTRVNSLCASATNPIHKVESAEV